MPDTLRAECPECGHDGDLPITALDHHGDSADVEVTCPECDTTTSIPIERE